MALVVEQKLNDGPIHLFDKNELHIEIQTTAKKSGNVIVRITAPDSITILRDSLWLAND